MSADILIVDDEEDICKLVQGILQDEGYHTRIAANANQAYEEIEKQTPDLIIQDIWLQGSDQDGLQILENIKKEHSYLPIIMISGHGTIETAVSAIKVGAYDFIEKPFKADRLLLMVERALETASLRRENETLKRRSCGPVDLLGSSQAIQNLRQIIERVAATNSRILITGEPGTGKDITARVIHKNSNRAHHPFMMLSCATLRPERLEVELFGAEEGVNGQPAKIGLLEQANGGTLLLDEVADMPMETQGKIVRALQEQRFQKVGSDHFIEVDVRIIASTNYDLEEAMNKGDFRQDLYYRLNVVPIQMCSLKERAQDIPDLAAYFVSQICDESGWAMREFSESAMAAMQNYSWPGNIRQLRNMVEWMMIMSGNKSESVIDYDHLPPELRQSETGEQSATNIAFNGDALAMPLRDAREVFEREYLLSQINRFDGNISQTAKFVGMERSALHRKLKSLNILNTETKGDENSGNVTSLKSA